MILKDGNNEVIGAIVFGNKTHIKMSFKTDDNEGLVEDLNILISKYAPAKDFECAYCQDTGFIYKDERDISGNVMKGVDQQKCPFCLI